MSIEPIITIATPLSIAIAFFLIVDLFISKNFYLRLCCFLCLFIIEFVFVFFFSDVSGILVMALLLCGIIMLHFINANIKNYLKSIDIVLSILLIYTVFIFMSTILFILPINISYNDNVYKIIIQICLVLFGILMRRKKSLFTPSNNLKLLRFYLLFKGLFFIIFNFALPILFGDYAKNYYIILISFASMAIISFYFAKYVAKIENERRKSALKLIRMEIESEQIIANFLEMIRIKHIFQGLYKSLVLYIKTNDMPGLEEYFNKHITPIDEQFNKNIGVHEKIQNIHVPILKARIIEIVNTTSQLPNVHLVLLINSVINYFKMEEIDLFTIINIWIENAVEETTNQMNGEIMIALSQDDNEFTFYIKNTLVGGKSTPKPNNTHKGLIIVEEIVNRYPNVHKKTEIIACYYSQTLEVVDD